MTRTSYGLSTIRILRTRGDDFIITSIGEEDYSSAGGLAMGGSHLEQLQERVGERLGIVFIVTGAIVMAIGGMAFAWWTDYGVWNDVAVSSAVVIVLGVALLSYGVFRILKFRASAAYPRYVASRRHHKIARIEAKRLAQLSPSPSVQGQQPQTVIREREIREREIVKVKCRYCGSLNPDGSRNCGSCGALL